MSALNSQVSIITLRFVCFRRCATASARVVLTTSVCSSATFWRSASGILEVYGSPNFHSLSTSTSPFVAVNVAIKSGVGVACDCARLTVPLERERELGSGVLRDVGSGALRGSRPFRFRLRLIVRLGAARTLTLGRSLS